MAQGKTIAVTVVKVNNSKQDVTVPAKYVELVVVNNTLVVDKKDVRPGVNTATMK